MRGREAARSSTETAVPAGLTKLYCLYPRLGVVEPLSLLECPECATAITRAQHPDRAGSLQRQDHEALKRVVDGVRHPDPSVGIGLHMAELLLGDLQGEDRDPRLVQSDLRVHACRFSARSAMPAARVRG